MHRFPYMAVQKGSVQKVTATLDGKPGTFHALRKCPTLKRSAHYVVQWWSSGSMEKVFVCDSTSKFGAHHHDSKC